MAFIYALADSWTNAAVTYTGIGLNVTDTASAAGSLLMDLQVGGVSRFRVAKDGGVILPPNSYIDGQGGGTDLRVASNGAGSFIALAGSNSYFGLGSGNVQTTDTRLFRDAANTLAQRNGVNAQAFRVYNTFTDASNYERGFVRWSANALEIGTEAAGTGSLRIVDIRSAAQLDFSSFGARVVRLSSSGMNLYNDILFINDNTDDIGGATANRPRNVHQAGYWQTSEMTAPAAPAANDVRIYAEDNGAGKTRLMARFATGAAVQIAIEP